MVEVPKSCKCKKIIIKTIPKLKRYSFGEAVVLKFLKSIFGGSVEILKIKYNDTESYICEVKAKHFQQKEYELYRKLS